MVSADILEQWLSMQRQLLPKLRRAYVQLRGPAMPSGRAEATYSPDGDTDETLQLAAKLAESAGTPVSNAMESEDGQPRLRIAYPLMVEDLARGAIVVEVDASPGQQAAIVQLLEWGERWLRLILQTDAAGGGGRLDELIGPDPASADYQSLRDRLVDRLAAVLCCELLALGAIADTRVVLETVSGVPRIDQRGSQARALRSAMQEAWDLGEPVVLAREDDAEDRFQAHRTLLSETGAGGVCTLPLPAGEGRGLVCTLLVPVDTDPQAVAGQALPLLQGATPWLVLRREQQQPWPRRCARLLREAGHRALRPRWRRAVQLLVVLVLAGFLLLPTEYRLSADAVLEAASQQSLVAPFDSFVVEAPARAGETVAKAQLLARLDDRELQSRAHRLQAELSELDRERRRAMTGGKVGQARVLEAQQNQATARLALVKAQLQQTEIRPPIDGVVIAGDWQRRLGTPVSRGDTLFEVAPLKDYRVVLKVRDRDIAAVHPDQQGELVLTALPNRTLALRVTDIVTIAESEIGEPLFRVEARLSERPSELRPGMQGLAKVSAGERPRWWVWTHGLWDWMWLHLWRWLP